jgi:hypothetical protein
MRGIYKSSAKGTTKEFEHNVRGGQYQAKRCFDCRKIQHQQTYDDTQETACTPFTGLHSEKPHTLLRGADEAKSAATQKRLRWQLALPRDGLIVSTVSILVL